MQATDEDVKAYFRQAALPPTQLNMLLIDPNADAHQTLAKRFRLLKWTLTSATTAVEAVRLFETTRFSHLDAILIAFNRPELDVRTTTQALIQMGCTTVIFVLSDSCGVAVEGASGVLQRPFRAHMMIPFVLRELNTSNAKLAHGRQPRRIEPQCVAQEEEEMPTPHEKTKRGPVTVDAGNQDTEKWEVHDVSSWLANMGGAYCMYVPSFKANRINGERLLALKSSDIREMGVRNSLHEYCILTGIESLQQQKRNT